MREVWVVTNDAGEFMDVFMTRDAAERFAREAIRDGLGNCYKATRFTPGSQAYLSGAVAAVHEFHAAGKQPIRDVTSCDVSADERALRKRLLREEFDEYLEAEFTDDIVEIADALADMVYIICGTSLCYGIPLDRVFAEVHASNMRKFGPGSRLREDGKIIKPEGWQPPDVRGVLFGLDGNAEDPEAA